MDNKVNDCLVVQCTKCTAAHAGSTFQPAEMSTFYSVLSHSCENISPKGFLSISFPDMCQVPRTTPIPRDAQ